MSDLESSLLEAALDFAHSPGQELFQNLIPDGQALLRQIVPVPSQQQIDDVTVEAPVATDLTTAKNELDDLARQLAAATDLASIEAAFAQLGASLAAVDDAITAVTTATGLPQDGVLGGLVKTAVKAVGDDFGGLIDQLGLGDAGGLSDGFTSSGQVISYQLANTAGPTPLAPDGMLTLSDTTLSASLDYSVSKLSLQLATGLVINLASDAFVQEITVGGRLRTLAVEDECQAAGRPPADKHLLGADRTFSGLAALCDAPLLAGRELIRQLAFAYLSGNGDAHAKNFSVLQDVAGEWRVSPVYDAPCSQLYGDMTMALSIGGRSGSEFDADDFIALGETLSVPHRASRRAITDLAQRVDRWSPNLDQPPFDRGSMAKLRRVIRHRQSRLTARPEPQPGQSNRRGSSSELVSVDEPRQVSAGGLAFDSAVARQPGRAELSQGGGCVATARPRSRGRRCR